MVKAFLKSKGRNMPANVSRRTNNRTRNNNGANNRTQRNLNNDNLNMTYSTNSGSKRNLTGLETLEPANINAFFEEGRSVYSVNRSKHVGEENSRGGLSSSGGIGSPRSVASPRSVGSQTQNTM
jgi:hypothetical protein